MGRHIVSAFVNMGQIRHAGIVRGGDQAIEEVLQICLDTGVSVFLDEKRAGGVADEDIQRA